MPDIDSFSGVEEKRGDCIAIFHYETREDAILSEEAGHPVYEEVPYVEIIAPGNDKEIVNRRVTEKDKERWPREWAAFQNKEPVEYDGTPIKEWPQVSQSQAATLEAMHITTVEQLAEIADQNLGNVGIGMMDLKNKAKAWVEWQAGESSIQKYAQKLRRANERIEQLENQVAGLEGELREGREAQSSPPATEKSRKGSAKK